MVFQQFNLFPHLTALENLCEAPMQVLRRSARRGRRARRTSCSSGWAFPTRRTSTRESLRRAAAARRDRPRAHDGAGGDAVRRAHERAGSGDGRRGAGRDGATSRANGQTMIVVTHSMSVRPQRRQQRARLRRRLRRRIRPPCRRLRRSATRPEQGFSQARRSRLNPRYARRRRATTSATARRCAGSSGWPSK